MAPEVPVGTLDPSNPVNGTTPGAILDPVGITGQGQNIVAMAPENTGYLEALGPGASEAALATDYGFGEASKCPGCYENYPPDWDPNAHPGMDIPVGSPSAPSPYNNMVLGHGRLYRRGRLWQPRPGHRQRRVRRLSR